MRAVIDPTFIITHRVALADAADAYEIFAKRTENCIKVVLKPDMQPAPSKRRRAEGQTTPETWTEPRSKRLSRQ